MQEYQERVLKEKLDLDLNVEKLDLYIESDNFIDVSVMEQSLLKTQLTAMQNYSKILALRIKLF